MSNQLENAKNLYLRGIRDGEIKEVHENYMGASYTQHSTGVPDEKEGFAAFFEDFSNAIPSGKSISSVPLRTGILSLSMSTRNSMTVRLSG